MKTRNFLFGICGLAMAFTACSKNDDITSTNPANNGMKIGDTASLNTTYTKGQLILLAEGTFGVRNFEQGTGSNTKDTALWGTQNKYYYFNFAEHAGDSLTYDIRFQSGASGEIVVDTSKYQLRFVNKYFDDVTDTTGGTTIAAGKASFNTIYSKDTAQATVGTPTAAGWYIYNLNTHVLSAYAERSYLIVNKSSSVTYKLHMNSMYSYGKPATSVAASNYAYFSFDYKAL